MDQLQSAVEPYRHLDPVGWVGLYRFLPVWAGLVAMLVGVVMLGWGGGRAFRLVAGPLGAAIATVWAGTLAAKLGLGASERSVTALSTAALAGLGFIFPPVVIFFAFGVPIGLVAGELAGKNDWALGFVPGFLVGGAVGVVLNRAVSCVVSAAVGAWALTLGTLSALTAIAPGVVQFFSTNAVATVCVGGCVTLAGAVFQLFVRKSPEETDQARHERAMQKKREREKKELESRWSNYSKPKPNESKRDD